METGKGWRWKQRVSRRHSCSQVTDQEQRGLEGTEAYHPQCSILLYNLLYAVIV